MHVASTLAALMCSCKTLSFNRNLNHRNRVSDNPNYSFYKHWFSESGIVNKTQNTETDIENKLMDTKMGRWRWEKEGGMNWELGIDIAALLCIKWITNETLLYSAGNSTPCPGVI